MTWTADDAARRALPPGHRDEEHAYFIVPVFRTHYRCVTAPPGPHTDALDRHLAILDAACDWGYADHVRRYGPGTPPGQSA